MTVFHEGLRADCLAKLHVCRFWVLIQQKRTFTGTNQAPFTALVSDRKTSSALMASLGRILDDYRELKQSILHMERSIALGKGVFPDCYLLDW